MTAPQAMTLNDVVRLTGGVLQTGPFGSQLHASDYVAEGTPLVMPINLGDNVIREEGIARIGDEDVKRLSRHQLRPGDIVFGRRGDIGRRSIVREEQTGWLCGTGCLAVKFGKNLDQVNPDYVSLYVGGRDPQSWLAENAVGGTMPNLNTSILGLLPILLPTRDEQDGVVRALSDVSSFERYLQRSILKKRDIKQGMMQELLTGRTRLEGFDDPWVEGRLGALYERNTGTVDPRLSRANEFQHFSIPAFDAGGQPMLETGASIDSMKFTVPQKAVLVSKLNPRISRVWAPIQISATAIASTEFVVVIPAPGVHRSFLKWLLKSEDVAGRMTLLATGTTKSHVRIQPSAIANLEVAWPASNEQQAIASVLDCADEEIDALERRLKSTQAIKQGMMQELLTGRTRLPVAEEVSI